MKWHLVLKQNKCIKNQIKPWSLSTSVHSQQAVLISTELKSGWEKKQNPNSFKRDKINPMISITSNVKWMNSLNTFLFSLSLRRINLVWFLPYSDANCINTVCFILSFIWDKIKSNLALTINKLWSMLYCCCCCYCFLSVSHT